MSTHIDHFLWLSSTVLLSSSGNCCKMQLIVPMQMRVDGQLVQAAGGAAGTSCVQGPCHPCLPLQPGVLSSSETSVITLVCPSSLEGRSQALPKRWRPGQGRSMEPPGTSWIRSVHLHSSTICVFFLQGGRQWLRRPPPLCLPEDGPTRLPDQRHQVELHQVPDQQGGETSCKVWTGFNLGGTRMSHDVSIAGLDQTTV